MNHVVGRAVASDVSETAFQTERTGQWTKGKSGADFGQIGPWPVTGDDDSDLQHRARWRNVNGQINQNVIAGNWPVFASSTTKV